MPTEIHKLWAKHVASVVTGKPNVIKYWDDNEASSVDILSLQTQNGKVCASIGLMDIIQWSSNNKEIRSEILIESQNIDSKAENIISTACFFIMNDGWRIKPGVVFENVVSWYEPELNVKHLLFLPQFQWGHELSRVDISGAAIYPLLAIPITEPENKFIQKNGVEALESTWVENNVEVTNWGRKSAV